MWMIDEVMGRICDAGVAAVCRYIEVSGMGAYEIPELFFAPFIFDRLGNELTFTLESNVRTLLKWQEILPATPPTTTTEHSDAEGLHAVMSWRVDMIVYHGEQGTSKVDIPMYALIEIKKGWFSDELNTGARSDLDKLVVLMKHLHNVPYAAMVALVPERERAAKEKRARERGDTWYQRPVPSSIAQGYWFCAWLLQQGKGSLTLSEAEASTAVALGN